MGTRLSTDGVSGAKANRQVQGCMSIDLLRNEKSAQAIGFCFLVDYFWKTISDAMGFWHTVNCFWKSDNAYCSWRKWSGRVSRLRSSIHLLLQGSARGTSHCTGASNVLAGSANVTPILHMYPAYVLGSVVMECGSEFRRTWADASTGSCRSSSSWGKRNRINEMKFPVYVLLPPVSLLLSHWFLLLTWTQIGFWSHVLVICSPTSQDIDNWYYL